MKAYFLSCLTLLSVSAFAQTKEFDQQQFCQILNEIMEDGRKEDFEGIKFIMTIHNPLVPYHGKNLKLEGFPISYVDKDARFVAKTNLNMDSLSAVEKLEQCKAVVGNCLDSIQWYKWTETEGDDSTTVFFKEFKEFQAYEKTMTLTLAIIRLASKEYSVVMYIRKHK